MKGHTPNRLTINTLRCVMVDFSTPVYTVKFRPTKQIRQCWRDTFIIFKFIKWILSSEIVLITNKSICLIVYFRVVQIKYADTESGIPFISENQKVANTDIVTFNKFLPTLLKPNLVVNFLYSHTPNMTIRNGESGSNRKLIPEFLNKVIRYPLQTPKCKLGLFIWRIMKIGIQLVFGRLTFITSCYCTSRYMKKTTSLSSYLTLVLKWEDRIITKKRM